ncbi:MAG: ATP-binding protein [Anaerococcus hydrogenalis]|uniref:AAA family ATPase n=1 Tax=Anaerococcus hydrogenalis TaxID=33029 RepID=UPI002909B534|nr:ATP-binding protein [Anaerococcus hydrogenalis]MDU3687536.1 ATP-binding protein [Anaerococcus hydrogenalis]
MILEFSVSGFLSFKNEQTVYFTPFKGSRITNTKYNDNFHTHRKCRPMKSLLLFGDNASGKTNWFYALEKMKSIIKNGLGEIDKDIFNKHSNEISFGISLLDDNEDIYKYYISFNKDGYIVKEKLVKNDNEIYTFFNNKLRVNDLPTDKKEIKVLEKLFSKSSSNTLLLKLKDILDVPIDSFFKSIDNIKVVAESFVNKEMKWFPVDLFSEEVKNEIEKLKNIVISILQSLDNTIIDFKFDERIIDDKKGRGFEMILIRKNKDQFNLLSESLGIKKIIGLLPNILKMYDGKSIFIDELDSSIGSKALINLFNSFINSENNTTGQIIISTHNLTLLNLDMFKSSQMYFVYKNSDLSTVLHSLEEYDFRSGKKGINELYMKGSFDTNE